MRLLAEVTAPDIRQRSGFVRMMIVTNPAQPWVEPGQGVLFTYADAEDGPCCCRWPLTDLAFAKQFIRRKFKVPARAWREVPDQLPGCMDDWLGPVRLTRASADAAPLWERHVGGQWAGSGWRSMDPRCPSSTPPDIKARRTAIMARRLD